MKSILYIMALFMSTFVFAADPETSTAETTAADPATQATAETMPATESNTEATTTDATTPTATTTTETTNTETTAAEQAGFSRGSVVRSIFTTAIQDREPIDKLNNAASDTEQVFYFTELRDMSGQTATHRWEHDGKVMAEVQFDVRGPRWRVWSSKSFVPSTAGDWKVSVVNGAGETISEELISLSEIPHANSGSATPMNEMPTQPAATDAGTNSEPPLAPTGISAE